MSVTPSPFSPDGDGVDEFTAITYSLESASPLIRVRIFDSRGRIVRHLEEARLSSKTGRLVWNGLDDSGNPLRVGIYVVLLEAIDATAGRIEAYKAVAVLARRLR
jgi:hypothetical protein